MSNPLGAHSLLILLTTLLPQSTSSPLPHPTDAIAALVHTVHTALGFRLVSPLPASIPSSQTTETDPDIDDGASETPTAVEEETPVNEAAEGRLPEGWNARGEDSYAFEYRHEQSAMTFRIRVGRMGGRVQIDGMAEDGAPSSLSLPITDLLTPPTFPIPSTSTGAASASSTSPEAPAKTLGFKSVSSVTAFVDQYNRDIISKLLPGLSKAGYQQPAVNRGSDPRNPPGGGPVRPRPSGPGLIDPAPANNFPPNPASIGQRDLDPLASMRPPGTFNPQGDGGGMYMDFNHPLFDSRRPRTDLTGPGGSIQPPGARWDPVGPGMGGGSRFPGPGGNPLGGVGVTDPEWGDELPPPGEYGPDLGRMGGVG
ncbi:proteasome inhibitor subunit 1 (PI31), partial [Tremellales sp. Uapishka_1]